jgi:Ca2+-binding EF-hand superfamily protein
LSQEKRNELKKQAEMLSQARIQYGAGSIEYKMLLDSLQHDVAGSGENEQTQVAASSNAKERRKSTKVVPMSSSKKSMSLDLQTPKAVFAHFDKNDDQLLDKEEVRQAFQFLGCDMDDEKFEKTYSKCDKDNDGVINFKEFKKTL